MNYEFVVDVLDALAFCFVTPQLLGGTIVGARLRVSESRASYLLKRAMLAVLAPQSLLQKRKIDSEVFDRYWQKLWSGKASDASAMTQGCSIAPSRSPPLSSPDGAGADSRRNSIRCHSGNRNCPDVSGNSRSSRSRSTVDVFSPRLVQAALTRR